MPHDDLDDGLGPAVSERDLAEFECSAEESAALGVPPLGSPRPTDADDLPGLHT